MGPVISAFATGGGVGTVVVTPDPICAFTSGALVPAFGVVGIPCRCATSPGGVAPTAGVEFCGPIGAVPGDTVGICAVGRPESEETPGCAGAGVRPGGSELPTAAERPGVLEGARASAVERVDVPGVGAIVPGVVDVLLVPLLVPEAPNELPEVVPVPTVALVDDELPVAPAVPEEPEVPEAPAPDEPPAPPLWARVEPIHALVQSAVLRRKNFVFMAERVRCFAFHRSRQAVTLCFRDRPR